MTAPARRSAFGIFPLLLALALAAHALTTTASPVAPAPAAQAPAAPADDLRLEVIGQLSGPSRSVAVRGDLAYVGMGRRLVVVDVADPAQPREVGDLDAPEGVQGVAVDGDVSYLLLPDGSLRILDLAVPTAPRQVGAFTAPRHPAAAMALTRGHVLVVGAEGLQVIDVRDPAAPREASFVPGYGVDIAVGDDQAFVASGAGLTWFDIADLEQPRVIARVEVGGVATAVAYGDGVAAVATWPGTQFCPRAAPRLTRHAAGPSPQPAGLTPPNPHASCVHLLDVSRPPEGAVLAQLEIVRNDTNATRVLPGGLRLSDDHLFVLHQNSNYFGGYSSDLRAFDLADPVHPVEQSSAHLASGLQLALAGGRAYVALEDGGLATLSVRDPAAASVTGYLTAPADAQAVAAGADEAYLGDQQRVGLVAVDVADPATPRDLGFLDVGRVGHGAHDVVSDLALVGPHLFAVSGYEGLAIVDASDPAHLAGIRGLSAGDARTVAVAPPYAYVGSMDGSLRVVDVADLRQPKELGHLIVDAAQPLVDLAASAGLVYGVDGMALRVIDVADPAKPRAVGYARPTAGASALVVAGGFAYVTGAGGGVSVLDLANPSAPREIGRLAGDVAQGPGRSIAVSGHLVFVGHASAQLWAVDVTEPTRPRLAATIDLPSPALGIAVLGDHLQVAAGTDGLVVVALTMADQTPTPTGATTVTTPATPATATPPGTPVARRPAYLPLAAVGLRQADLAPPGTAADRR